MEKQRSMKRKSWSAFSVLFLVADQEMTSGGEPKQGKGVLFHLAEAALTEEQQAWLNTYAYGYEI